MKIINAEEFRQLKNQGNLVVDFFADWCGPCKMLGPIMEKVSEEYNDVNFVKINVDDEQDLAVEYGIMSIPAVFFLKDGNVVDQFLGLQQERFIKDKLDKNYR